MPPAQITRKPLNQTQLDILFAIYKFRFVTAQLLKTHLQLSRTVNINAKLNVLQEQGLIGRTYEPNYKLLGKPASYHLLSKSFKILRDYEDTSPKVLNNIRRDPAPPNASSLTIYPYSPPAISSPHRTQAE
ncbi:MarR family transcriptional regulator [bacterium]|nr:MAG: MarR family transcriptional regulator [bacterium]